jgi:hypothetical protein
VAKSLRVDPAGLRAAAAEAGTAAEGATPGSAQVQPVASDFVSVAASTRFSALVDLARKYTAVANAMARQFGVTLQASATAYESREAESAAMLGGQGVPAAAGASPAGLLMPAAVSGATGLIGGQALAAPAGEVPTAPRDIARLIDSGRAGAGVRKWEAAETSLRSDAEQLDDAAHELGLAISKVDDSWDSVSAQAATTRMRALQGWYHGHARYVRALAEQATAHVGNFRKATTDIPTYKQVVDGERELKTAQEANQRSGGTLKPAVVHAQVKLGQLYQASTAGFASYTVSEAVPEPQVPAPPPGPAADQPDVIPATGPGSGPVVTQKPEPAPKSAPLEPVTGGPGVGESLTTGGPTWPPAPVDPAAPGQPPLVQTVSDTAGSVIPQLVPGIIGAVVGGLGGVLGGLAGAGQKALQNLEQAASPLMSGLGQHPPGGAPHGGEQSPQSPQPQRPQPPNDVPAPGDAGGGGGADTEPAGGSEPMSAPTAVAATPTSAVPISAPNSAPAAVAPAPAIGAMGPMVPPLMGGPRSEPSSPENQQLYRERKLMVVAPPNSEPVKNRREGREKARGTDRKTT